MIFKKKSEHKSALVTELFKLFGDFDTEKRAPPTESRVFDFMAYARKVPVIKADLENYNNFGKYLMDNLLKLSQDGEEIHVLFDDYQEGSIKTFERNRKSSAMLASSKFLPVPITIQDGK